MSISQQIQDDSSPPLHRFGRRVINVLGQLVDRCECCGPIHWIESDHPCQRLEGIATTSGNCLGKGPSEQSFCKWFERAAGDKDGGQVVKPQTRHTWHLQRKLAELHAFPSR